MSIYKFPDFSVFLLICSFVYCARSIRIRSRQSMSPADQHGMEAGMFGTRSGRGAAIGAAIGMLGAAPGFAQSPAALATPAVAAAAPTLKTLTAFDGIDGELPGGSLIAD